MYKLCIVTRRQGESIVLSPKSRKQYEGIYIEVKAEIKILKGKTTNI
jgi:sRNA-binding carbon storage regulator CsrA